MLSLALLVALGVVECTCLYLTRRPGRGWTSMAHLVLLAAMVAMLTAPTTTAVVVGATWALGAIVAFAVVDRSRNATSTPVCGGQLILCSAATLTMLLAMALVPTAASGPATAAMGGMPDMAAASSTVGAWLPGAIASVVLALFAVRAVLEIISAVQETVRTLPFSRLDATAALRHSAAAAGSLSMVVMCAAMGA